MTSAVAATILGVSERRVRALKASGARAATKHGRDWHITTRALPALARLARAASDQDGPGHCSSPASPMAPEAIVRPLLRASSETSGLKYSR